MSNNVFQHLTEEEWSEFLEAFKAQGMSDDDAFTEVYAIDCNMDEEEE